MGTDQRTYYSKEEEEISITVSIVLSKVGEWQLLLK
jgi:hypothetical protein